MCARSCHEMERVQSHDHHMYTATAYGTLYANHVARERSQYLITFFISALLSGVPTMIEVRQAREANMALTLEGLTTSPYR